MTVFEIAATLLVLAALFSYFNCAVLKFPPAIGLMAMSLAASLGIVVAGTLVPAVERQAVDVIRRIDLNQAFLHSMLGFLLFAGALHVRLDELASRRWIILALATVGVLVSTAAVGLMTWLLLHAAGIPARIVYCLMFGALISPTDPIAVMAILRRAGVPKDMEIKIAGESLFNDGVAVVAYFGLLEIATGSAEFDPLHLGELFLWEAVGGAVVGFVLAWITYRMLLSVDHYQVEVMLSLALVAGGYALVNRLHMSGPIAMVVAGLLIGNLGRAYAMSPEVLDHMDKFWELLDEILNAVLFVLIGLEVLALNFAAKQFLLGLAAVPLVLLARLISIAPPIAVLRRRGRFARYTVRVLTWGGLRGGISVALALAIPREARGEPVFERDSLLAMTYVVVVFSILVQGLTLGPLVKRWMARPRPTPPRRTST